MSLFTIYDLILLVIIATVLFIFLKPKGILAGVKIMFASLKIFANHKVMFLQNALFLIFVRIITPVILVIIIYGVAIIINTATDKINISFLHNFMAIAGLIWIFGSAILAGLSFQILVSFAEVVFYRQLLQIIAEDSSERKFSFKEIIGQETKHCAKLLKFLSALLSVIVSTWIKAFSMIIGFLFSNGRFSLNCYLLPRYIKQVLCYVPMEYALYHNSPKRAIIKSYQINREWTALSAYGVAASFLVAMMIAFFICYIMGHLNDINVLFNMEMLVEKIGATPTMILFWFIFVAIILSFSVPICLPISAFYFIVYLNYNNSIIEGKTDKFSKDFGLFGSFLDSVSELLAKKFGSEPIPIYEEYIPIKEKYKKMIEFNSNDHKIPIEEKYAETNKASLSEYKISVEEKRKEKTKLNFSKYKKLFQKKSVLVVIFLMLSVFVYYFIATDKFAHPISPDFSTIPECPLLDFYSFEGGEISCQVKFGTTFDLIKKGGGWDSDCKIGNFGGCFIADISYDKKYIQKMKNRYEGKKCNISEIHRFKGIKKGYTEIVVDGHCDCNKKIKIFIR